MMRLQSIHPRKVQGAQAAWASNRCHNTCFKTETWSKSHLHWYCCKALCLRFNRVAQLHIRKAGTRSCYI